MKVCIVGNSHIACIKKAWDSLDASLSENFTLAFFGSHADTLLNTTSDENGIYPSNEQVANSFKLTSGGYDHISFEKYDALVLHGFSPSFRNYLSLSNYLENNSVTSRFRDECFFNISLTMGKMIESALKSKLPVYVTPRPCVSYSKQEDIEEKDKISEEVYSKVMNFVKDGFESRSLSYIPQPVDTLIYYNFTKKKYNEAGIGLGAVPKNDNSHVLSSSNLTHMNQLYGKAYLESLFDLLK